MSKEHEKFPKILIVIAVTIILAGLLNVMFYFDKFTIAGQSMFPTIVHGDKCITANKFFFMDLEYKRNNIIMFRRDGNYIVKRIIGIPGDHVQINESNVTINGHDVNSNSILYSKMDEVRDITLGSNQYFVLGDNRPYSQDSRHDGPIKKHNIVGKVLVRWRSWSVP